MLAVWMAVLWAVLMAELAVVMTANVTVALLALKKAAGWDFATAVEKEHFLVARKAAARDFSVVAVMVYTMVG